MFRERVKAFSRNVRGGLGVILALTAPVLITAVAAAVDYGQLANQREALQAAADIAAVGAVKEAPIHRWYEPKITEIAKSYVALNVKGSTPYTDSIDIDRNGQGVTVTIAQESTAQYFLKVVGALPTITVKATARLLSNQSLCLLGLDPSSSGTVALDGNSSVIADDCSANSNSDDRIGLVVTAGSQLKASGICTSGGFVGLAGTSPRPVTDCPPLPDPIAMRGLVDTGICRDDGYLINGGSFTLDAGTHCGPVYIRGGAAVMLAPGIHTFENGLLLVQDSASLTGNGVSLQFSGTDGGFRFENSSSISLSAPADGQKTGILIHVATVSDDPQRFAVLSQHAERLVGVIYAPDSPFLVGGDSDEDGKCDAEWTITVNLPGQSQAAAAIGGQSASANVTALSGALQINVNLGNTGGNCDVRLGQASEWTAIVSKRFLATLGANVMLNSDYDASTIAPPEDIRGVRPVLTH